MPGHPNPVRRLESHGVVDQTEDRNPPFCLPEQHYMRSVKTRSPLVPYVEQCATCLWIDPASLTWWAEDAVKKSLSSRAQRIALAAESEPFSFHQSSTEELTLEEVLFQALGAASMCWESVEKAGVFDSTRASKIGHALLAEVLRFARMRGGRDEDRDVDSSEPSDPLHRAD